MSRAATSVIALALLAIAMLASSCATDDRETVLVMAAASLTDAFGEIEVAFEAAHPEFDVQLNLAGSASLREQILQGAPADVFASANQPVMQTVADAGTVTKPFVFATNELALAVPAGNEAGVTGLADLANEDLLVGLCAAGVPCGDFARTALDQAGVTAAADTNDRDVRSLVTKIAAGELDVGIVYRTDVLQSTELESIDLPPVVDVAIDYPIARLAEPVNPIGALLFVEFVQSPAGQAILSKNGFGAP